MNPKSWIHPETFRPERFLDSEEKVINKDRIVSFSLGTVCVIHKGCRAFFDFVHCHENLLYHDNVQNQIMISSL